MLLLDWILLILWGLLGICGLTLIIFGIFICFLGGSFLNRMVIIILGVFFIVIGWKFLYLSGDKYINYFHFRSKIKMELNLLRAQQPAFLFA